MNYDKLRIMRTRCGLSITEISQRSGVPEPTIKRIFSGKTADPQFQTITALVYAMGGSLDEIIDENIKRDTPANAESDSQKSPEITNDTTPIIGDTTPITDDTTLTEKSENTVESFKHVIDSYKQQLSDETGKYEKEIERLMKAYSDRINALRREKVVLAFALGFLILYIIVFFTYDVLNPNVGWLQS